MFETDELPDGAFGRFHQLADRISAAVRPEHGETKIQITVLSAIFNSLVEEADIDLGCLEHDEMIGLHFACALGRKIAAHPGLEPVEARLAYIDRAKVFHEIVKRDPENALIARSRLMMVIKVVVILTTACLFGRWSRLFHSQRFSHRRGPFGRVFRPVARPCVSTL